MTDRSDLAALVERIEELDRIFTANPRTIEFITLADALLQADRYRQAYDVLRTGLRYRPDHVEARVLLGESLLRAGRLRAATREVAQVLKTDQQHIGAMLVLARALALDNRGDEARVILKRARSKRPSDPRIAMVFEHLDDPEMLQSINLPGPLRERPIPGYIANPSTEHGSLQADVTADATASVIIDQSYAWELAELPVTKSTTAPGLDGDTSVEAASIISTNPDESITQVSISSTGAGEATLMPRVTPSTRPLHGADDTVEVPVGSRQLHDSTFPSANLDPTMVLDAHQTVNTSEATRKLSVKPKPAPSFLIESLSAPPPPRDRDTEPSINEPSSSSPPDALDWESVLTGPNAMANESEDGETSLAGGLPQGLETALREGGHQGRKHADTITETNAEVTPRDTPPMSFGPPSVSLPTPVVRQSLADVDIEDETADVTSPSIDEVTRMDPSLGGAAEPAPMLRRSITVRGPLGGEREASESMSPRPRGPSVPSRSVPPVSIPPRPEDSADSAVDQNWFQINSQPPAQRPARSTDPPQVMGTPRATVDKAWLAASPEEESGAPAKGSPRPSSAPPSRNRSALGAESDLVSPRRSIPPERKKAPSGDVRRLQRSAPVGELQRHNSTISRPQTVPLPKRRPNLSGPREGGRSVSQASKRRGELSTPTPASARREPVVSGGPPPRRAPSEAPAGAPSPRRKKKDASGRPLPRQKRDSPRKQRKSPPKLPQKPLVPPIPEPPPPSRRHRAMSAPPPIPRAPDPSQLPIPGVGRAQRYDHVVETVAGRSLAEMGPPPSPWGRVASLTTLIATLVLALVVTLRYRTVVADLETEYERVFAQIVDGNYASRVNASALLEVPIEEPGFLARLGDSTARLLGRSGFSAALGERTALYARLEAERVFVFGDYARKERAQELARAAEANAPDKLNTRIALALLALHDHDPKAAGTWLESAPEELRNEADFHWVWALIAEALGDSKTALSKVERALQQDDQHPHAGKLRIDLKVKGGNYSVAGGLDDYERLLTKDKPGHLDAQIALERLRIQVRKRPGEAVKSLKRLLSSKIGLLSPSQAALAHDSVGLYYLKEVGEQTLARKAYTAARDAAPRDSRFVVGLARLDMQSFELDSAEKALEDAIASNSAEPVYKTMLAEIALLRGDAVGALKRLSSIERRSAEANLLYGRAHLERAESPLSSGKQRAQSLDSALSHFEVSRSQATHLVDAETLYVLTRILIGKDRERHFRTLADLRQRPIEPRDKNIDPAIKYRSYARALAARGSQKRATQAYGAVLHGHPRDFRSQYGICRAQIRRLRATAALAACQRVVMEMNSAYTPARQQWAVVAEFLDKPGVVATALGPLRARGLLHGSDSRRLARAMMENGQLAKLEALADEQKAVNDQDTEKYMRGLLAQTRGDLRSANDFLAEAAKGLSKDSHVLIAYGDLLLKTGQSTKAIDFFRSAMELDRDPMAALGLAKAYMQKGDSRSAATAARRAERRASRSLSRKQVRGEALALRAQAAIQQGRRGRRKANRLLKKAKKIDDKLPAIALTEGLLAERSQKPADAIRAYSVLTTVAPRDPEGHFRLGRLLLSDRKTRDVGKGSLEMAIKLDSQGAWGDRARQLLGK